MRFAGLALILLSGIGLAARAGSEPAQGVDQAPFPNSYYPQYSVANETSIPSKDATSEPKYPSPWIDGSGDWGWAYKRAEQFVSQLTIAEKINLTTSTGWQSDACEANTGSIPRLGFRGLCATDGPLGVRFTDYNSVFPAGITVAASFDPEIWRERGYATGSEFRDKGVDIYLAPVVSPLGRSPEGGRMWEGFGADAYLAGQAAAHSIKGLQSAGVMATIKHYIANEQEHFRQISEAASNNFTIYEALSSNIDDTTLHEVYLWPFADAVRAGVASVMCAYTQVNNSYSCQNSYMLNHLLKGELGFQGYVMSDWQGQKSGISAALAGMDMAMPGDTLFSSGYSFWGTNLTIGILNGTMPQWRLDDMAMRIMAAYYYVGRDKTQIPLNFNAWTLDTMGFQHYRAQKDFGVVNQHVDVRRDHGKKIRKMAAKSTVLLKNTKDTLPLDASKEKFTTVFGSDAGDNEYGPNGCTDRGCDQGTLGIGWGSGTASYPYLITPLQAITNKVQNDGNGMIQGITNDYATEQISALARQASVALVFVNADSGEGYITVDGNYGDRNNLTLWHDGEALINTVAAQNNKTVVVIHSGGPVLVNSFKDNPNVTAIVWAGMPGQESGNSIVDVLYGDVNPGAKLPFTIGAARQDYSTDVLYKPNEGTNAPEDVFGEGQFYDYRAFDRYNVTPVYEFGYGLSYTTFNFSHISVQPHKLSKYQPTNRMTKTAPTLGKKVGQASDYVFPTSIDRVPLYIYPYINSTDLKASYGYSDYGTPDDQWLPAGSQDGKPFAVNAAGGAPGGNEQLWDVAYTVRATVTNTGKVAGDEVAQLYVSLGGDLDAKRVLRGFQRLTIKPGQSATFEANLTRRDISNWDTTTQNWIISNSPKTVYVGSSSRKIPLHHRLDTSTIQT
jgi:beta-glucosidase